MRPSVARLAERLGVAGFVRNDGGSVLVEVEGARAAVERFVSNLSTSAPPLAVVEGVTSSELTPTGDRGFRIHESEAATRGGLARISPDVAPCDRCLSELRSSGSRRHRHAFVTCTDCGPRFSIVAGLPFDRARTSMSRFAMCALCADEYGDPDDRRYHAETIACPACGPRLHLMRSGCDVLGDPIVLAASAIAAGQIVALLGVGGFALAVDATDEAAVARLRERKRRPHKPLAVMARSIEEAERIAIVDDAARRALVSAARPIVLLRRRAGAVLAPSVAPALAEVGVFLPPSPLQQLLLDEGPALQVMTSGNVSGEPIVTDPDAALTKLGAIADVFLVHDREVRRRVDDSVVRILLGERQVLRRARGLVPEPLSLPVDGPPVLAVGADLKNAVCLAHDGRALLSQHIGDLSHPLALAAFDACAADVAAIAGVTPTAVAHDLHPDYFSTARAFELGLPTIGVQHHHAHVAACLAEHRCLGPAIGVAFDGTGCGLDGSIWGGEILVFDLASFERRGHLRPLRLAGGEAAIREPWRVALAALVDAGFPRTALERVDGPRAGAVERLLLGGAHAPFATGAGRWFDAIASLAGIRDTISYEGQAAIELEAAAADEQDARSYSFAIDEPPGAPFVIDLRPSVGEVLADREGGATAGAIGARFYETMAHAAAAGCVRARAGGAPNVVALSGGCFQSARLTERTHALLTAEGFEVLVHRSVPPNDGGIAYGQAAIASALSVRTAPRAKVR